MINDQLGIMQGRLSKSISGKMQEFPEFDWENEFPICEKLNITRLEWTLDSKNLFQNPIFSDQSRVFKISNFHGVKIDSITLDNFVENPFYTNISPELDDFQIDLFKKIIISLGSSTIKILVLPLVKEACNFNNFNFEILVERLNSLENHLLNSNLKIALECEFSLEKIEYLLSNLSPKLFGINFDMGNSAALGHQPDAEFQIVGQRILNVHIKDRFLHGPTCILGNGSVNFNEVFEHLEKINYKANLIMQTYRNPDFFDYNLTSTYIEFINKYLSKKVN